MPLADLNAGSRWANKPDCSVDVVEAITIEAVCAQTDGGHQAAKVKAVPARMAPLREPENKFKSMHFMHSPL
jgi:hypothetical protein